jgi:hypothetical protein
MRKFTVDDDQSFLSLQEDSYREHLGITPDEFNVWIQVMRATFAANFAHMNLTDDDIKTKINLKGLYDNSNPSPVFVLPDGADQKQFDSLIKKFQHMTLTYSDSASTTGTFRGFWSPSS